jgi:hypothetical protein
VEAKLNEARAKADAKKQQAQGRAQEVGDKIDSGADELSSKVR